MKPKVIFSTLFSCAVVSFFLCITMQCQAFPQEPAVNKNASPIVIAHCGACGYLPEHTLEAAAMAHSMRVDFIEQDVVLTQDNIPVVLHDLHLDTVTNVAKAFPDRAREDGRFYAIDFSLAEIKQLEVHERIDLKTGKRVYPDRFNSSKLKFEVPTLEEEIELIQSLNASTGRDVGIYVEFKAPAWHRKQGKDISQIALKILNDCGYISRDDNIFLQCFDPVETRRIREELGSKLKLVQLIADNSWKEADTDFDQMRTEAGLKTIAEYADGIGAWVQHVREPRDERSRNTKLVRYAHEAGLFVHVFTLRKDSLPTYAKSFDRLILAMIVSRVDGFFTDFPDLVIDYQTNRNRKRELSKAKEEIEAKAAAHYKSEESKLVHPRSVFTPELTLKPGESKSIGLHWDSSGTGRMPVVYINPTEVDLSFRNTSRNFQGKPKFENKGLAVVNEPETIGSLTVTASSDAQLGPQTVDIVVVSGTGRDMRLFGKIHVVVAQ